MGDWTDNQGLKRTIQTREWDTIPVPARKGLQPHDSIEDYAVARGLTRIGKGVPMEVALWRIKVVAENMKHPQAGTMLAAIDAAVAAMEGPEGVVARHSWNGGNVLVRYSPMVLSLGRGMGLGDAELDAVFRAAAAIPA
jgi:hypothetical protein